MARQKEISRKARKDVRRKPIAYIVCEGEETEVRYFKRFRRRESLIDIIPIPSKYKAADRLVQKAVSTVGFNEYDPKNGDVIWCVFDRDENTDEMLEKARRKAGQENLRIAFSNPSFELWFLLHFCFQTAALRDCSDVIRHLRVAGRIENYEKNRDYYDFLLPYMDKAVERSERRIRELEREKIEPVSRDSNPVSSVSSLVTFLLER